MTDSAITIPELRATFVTTIEAAGGALHDQFADAERLILRATLPWIADVRPSDPIQGGVAMRATLQEAVVLPFIVRKVCVNGAIGPQAIELQRIARLQELPASVAREKVRDAVGQSARRETFAKFTDDVRAIVDGELLNPPMMLLALLRDQPGHVNGPDFVAAFTRILSELTRGSDRSRFGLMNAITAVARDTRDPETRWRLEELGGAVAALPLPTVPRLGAAAVRVVEEAGVGARG
jgi:hypothetical protein